MQWHMGVYTCVRACVSLRVRACAIYVRVCVLVCARARVRVGARANCGYNVYIDVDTALRQINR